MCLLLLSIIILPIPSISIPLVLPIYYSWEISWAYFYLFFHWAGLEIIHFLWETWYLEWPFLEFFALSNRKSIFIFTQVQKHMCVWSYQQKKQMDKELSDPKLHYIYSLLMIIIIVLLTSGKHFSCSRVPERDDKGWKCKVTDHIETLKRYLLYWVLYVLSKQDYKLISYNYFKEELFLMSSPSLEISKRGVRLGREHWHWSGKKKRRRAPEHLHYLDRYLGITQRRRRYWRGKPSSSSHLVEPHLLAEEGFPRDECII